MTTHPALRCPECGGITRRITDEDGDTLLVCTSDACPRIIAYGPVDADKQRRAAK